MWNEVMKIYRSILIIFLFLIPLSLFSQDTEWEKVSEGEIEDASFIVEKSLEIELPQQNREFEKVPPLPSTPKSRFSQTYNYLSILPELSNLNISNRALKLKSQPLEKFYGGNISAGFGNYVTPFLNASLFNKRENKYALGLNFNHISSRNGPVDKENSGSSDTDASFNSRYYGEKLTVGAKVNYKRNMVHYYGYPEGVEVDSDSIRQVYNTLNIGYWFGNTNKKDDIDYIISANYNYIKDKFTSSESKTEVDLQSNYFLREGLKFHLDVNTMFSSYKSLESLSRNLIEVKPYIYYRFNNLDIKGGLNFVFHNDTLSTRSDVLLYPFIRLDYYLNDYFGLFLNIDGDMEQLDFQSVVDQNPYLDEGVALLHSNRKFGIDLGIQGNVNNYFNLLAGIKLSEYKDLYFFMNDSLQLSKFKLIYDHEGTSVVNVYGELIYSRIKSYNVGIRADYYSYSTKSIADAWHRPAFKLTGTLRYNLYDKIVIGSNIYFLAGIKAYDSESDEVIKLSSIFDLNLNINYLFSDQLGVMLRFDNIIGRNYERYWRYPSRGIQILGGVSFNF
jgi:hypothetical protein